jgi:glycosyltransferase involved in cell wall biosynthesis
MKISVITASYNQGKYIGKCIDSVLQSSHHDVEQIILDNCSTDETATVLRGFSAGLDTRIRIEIRPDEGQTATINEGFLKASGEVVAWLNTDEYYASDTLENVSRYFDENPEVDIIFGDCIFVSSSGRLTKRRDSRAFNRNMLLYYGCYIPSCSTFFRKRIITDGQLLDEQYKICMDYEYYVRLSEKKYTFRYVRGLVSYFTWHGDNLSTKYRARRLEERARVLNTHGGLAICNGLRPIFFEMLRCYWIFRRQLASFDLLPITNSNSP